MTLVSIGDLARSMVLQSGIGQNKANVQRLVGELTSGRHSDPAKVMRGDFTALGAIEASLARLKGWDEATTDLGLRLGMMQTALASVDSIASQVSESLLTATGSGTAALVDSAGANARQQFGAAVGFLNTRFGDRSLFAGAATGGPALSPAEGMLDDLMVVVAGAANADDAIAAVEGWFASPTGFGATGYRGSLSAAGPVPVGPGETVQINGTAADPALRDLLGGLAMAALLDRGLFGGNDVVRSDVAQAAGLLLFANGSDRAHLAAGIGMVEAQVASAQARNGTETGTLEIGRAGLIAADPFKTATELEAAQTQLETLYALTARVSQLDLTDYLR